SSSSINIRMLVSDSFFDPQMSGDAGVSAFPEGENIFSWIGTIEGSKGTAYEGLSYKLFLKFPLDYPFKPPLVKFETPCFHPNIDQCGNICLDILQVLCCLALLLGNYYHANAEMWSSAYDCRTILLSIQSLLGDYKKMVHKQYLSGGEALES
ncbi:hypothetical protein GW17_00036554, partial [Ensete ventricosum]